MEMVMPHSREAEEVVLGALINDKDKVEEVEESLLYDEFYYDKHKIIYKGILNLRRREEQIDLITLCEELKTMDTLDKVGGGYHIFHSFLTLPLTLIMLKVIVILLRIEHFVEGLLKAV